MTRLKWMSAGGDIRSGMKIGVYCVAGGCKKKGVKAGLASRHLAQRELASGRSLAVERTFVFVTSRSGLQNQKVSHAVGTKRHAIIADHGKPLFFDGVAKPNVAEWNFKQKFFVVNLRQKALDGMSQVERGQEPLLCEMYDGERRQHAPSLPCTMHTPWGVARNVSNQDGWVRSAPSIATL